MVEKFKNSDYNKTILIAGFGSIGKRHTNILLKHTKSKIAIFSRRSDISNNDFHDYKNNKNRILIYNKIDDAFNCEPHVAFITNNTCQHVDISIKIAKKGINLFIEKPLSNTMAKIKKLINIVNKKNLIVMVGCNLRFYPPLLKIKQIVNEDLIGKIISVQIENGTYLPDWHPHEDYTKGYAARADLGGGVTLTQIHEIDFMTWIFGDVLSSKAYVGKFSNLNITSDDLCSAIFLLNNNIIVELHMDFFVRPYYKRIKIRGNEGIILWDSTSNKLRKYHNVNKKWDLLKINKNYKLTSRNNNHMYVTQIDYYLDCLLKNKQPMNNLEEANKILKYTMKLFN